MYWIKCLFYKVNLNLITPILVFLFAFGVATLGVSTDWAWSKIYETPLKQNPFAQEDAAMIARHLWSDEPYEQVNLKLRGGRFIQREIDHYNDLQQKYKQLQTFLLMAGAWIAVTVFYLDRKKLVLRSLWMCLSLVCIGGAWASIHWLSLFNALHWILFQDDSWILPWSSYSLRLFPYSVWKVVMMYWITAVLAIYAGIAASALLLPVRRKKLV